MTSPCAKEPKHCPTINVLFRAIKAFNKTCVDKQRSKKSREDENSAHVATVISKSSVCVERTLSLESIKSNL